MVLKEFFQQNNRVALAFSGGVDSAYLLYAASRLGAEVKAYYVKTPFQPQFEYEDALRLAAQLQVPMVTLELDVLSDDTVTANPQNRCYFCKKQIFSVILEQAKKDGFPLVIDGTNASDDVNDRPGMQALGELGVRSPLRECGLTKPEIRKLSKAVGLFTHDKPAYACLATRIPTGTAITAELLEKTEKSEAFLMGLGFSDFRIRLLGDAARIQVKEKQIPLLIKHRQAIITELKKHYSAVLLDLEVRA
ncbi:MAG: ATP-dependent sacrificial sulfur transferase LarE [Oscillospiraceae bacterium]|nr:ATP-dependent sacrificial sulfur transferase LarE [Oscillospiraceae bacterium]